MFSDSEALLRLILRNNELTATPLAAAAAAALMANQAAAAAAVSSGSDGSPQSTNPLSALAGLSGLTGHHHLSSLASQLSSNSDHLSSSNSALSHDLPMDLHKPSTSTTPPCSSATGSSPSSVASSVTSAAAAASLALQSLSAKFPLLAARSQSPSSASVQRSARQYTMSAFPGTSTSRVTTAGSEQIQVHRQADGSLAYSCDFCGFMSNNRHTILRHRRTHTGERPYACTLCSYKAIQMWNLEQHIKRRHPHAAPPSGMKSRREAHAEGNETPPPPSLTRQHQSMAAALFGALPPPPWWLTKHDAKRFCKQIDRKIYISRMLAECSLSVNLLRRTVVNLQRAELSDRYGTDDI